MNIIGDVEGKNIVFFDDVISTGRTLCQAAEAMRANGAREIYAGATHAVLADGAADRILASPIREVVVTDTVPHDPQPPERQVHGAVGRRTCSERRFGASTRSARSARCSSDNRTHPWPPGGIDPTRAV